MKIAALLGCGVIVTSWVEAFVASGLEVQAWAPDPAVAHRERDVRLRAALQVTHQPLEELPGLFMEKLAGFLKLYLPVFLLGALFGKLIELAGFSSALVSSVMRLMGAKRAMPAIVLVCAVLTYGGVSLFVVVFAAYPFAAEMFRRDDIPKRLIPGTIALGAFTFTMDALPGTPQIQNIIPTAFFGTTAWAAPCSAWWAEHSSW